MNEAEISERFALAMSEKDARIKELERERDLYRMQLMGERDTFLGWPVRMWFEIQDWLMQNGYPERSPLSILSRLVENYERSRR